MNELRLTEIWIYPIKSLGGIRLKSSRVLQKGLTYDRRWMLVDENGIFLTQRVHPVMALFKLSLSENHLIVARDADTIAIPFNNTCISQPESVRIWDDAVEAHEVHPSISSWFSIHLGIKCRLMYSPETYARPVDPEYKVNDEHVSFADAYPFLIIGEAALQQLNEKLSNPLPMNRFRPNLVFSGGKPHEEDTWRNFTIGTNKFVGVKPCARCVMITINQDTAEKGIEPTKTLASYRVRNNKIYFGQNLVALNHAEVKEGDIIQVESYTSI